MILVNDGSPAEARPSKGKEPADMPSEADVQVQSGHRKRGRVASNIWDMFTKEERPATRKSAVCQNCNMKVNYHKKTESVIVHLNKCLEFRKLMNGMDIEDRPEWYSGPKKRRAPPAHSKALSLGTSDSKSQSSIRSFALPQVDAATKMKFQKMIAYHYYCTGTSFQRVEDQNLVQAVKMLQPDEGLLPSRKKLAGELLDVCYDDIKQKCDAKLSSLSSDVCLVTDGWSNIHNEPVVNYIAASRPSLFIEAVHTGEQGHTAEWIAQDVGRVIRKHANTIFAGAVTDNTAANKKAWLLLKGQFPDKFFQGCTSHTLHLLVKDIFGATKTKKRGESVATFPVGYPFESLLIFAESCKDVVKFFHNHHAVKVRLRGMQLRESLPMLIKPAPTRWGSLQQCFSSILKSEKLLFSIVSERDFVPAAQTAALKSESTRIKDIITDTAFVSQLNKALNILGPIDQLIVKYQSDDVPLSDVLPDFNKLPTRFAASPTREFLSHEELQYLTMLANQRFEFMYSDAHGLAYLLDPRYLGEGISHQHRSNLEDILINLPLDSVPVTDEKKSDVYMQYTEFVIAAQNEKANSTFRYKMLTGRRKTPLQYWQADGCVWKDLQKIGVRIFSMVTSSASSERNFSTFGFVHSKLRNSLGPAKVDKLVFIKTNYPAFSDCKVEDESEFSEADSSDGNSNV